MESLRTIVVCGATGKQGGAVLNALVASRQWNVVAFSRDPNSEKAEAIRKQGVRVVYGDLADKASLIDAFKGAFGVYAVTMPMNTKGKIDTELEWQQGNNIVEACVVNQIRHIVFSSVMYVEHGQENTLTYIKRKIDIENLIQQHRIPFTFLCPGSFMDDFGGEYLPIKKNVITGMARDDAKLPWIACRDIGKFAAAAFAQPDAYLGKKLNLIGDFISGSELAGVASKVSSRGITYRHKAIPIWLMQIFARVWIPLRRHFERWGQAPYPDPVLEAQFNTRQLLPDTLTFEQYLKWKGWDKKL